MSAHTDSEAVLTLAAKLVEIILADGERRTDRITHLRWGEGLRGHPEGFSTEAEYLAYMRRAYPLRVSGAERNSHRRWSPYVGVVDTILETKDASWRGNAQSRRRRARQVAAGMWYGCPNIILGT